MILEKTGNRDEVGNCFTRSVSIAVKVGSMGTLPKKFNANSSDMASPPPAENRLLHSFDVVLTGCERLVDPRRKTEKKKVDVSFVSFVIYQPILHTLHHNEETTKRRTYSAVGANEATHVLDKTEDGHADLTTEADLFPDIGQGHCLRGRHQYHSVWVVCLQMLHNRNVLVRCA